MKKWKADLTSTVGYNTEIVFLSAESKPQIKVVTN